MSDPIVTPMLIVTKPHSLPLLIEEVYAGVPELREIRGFMIEPDGTTTFRFPHERLPVEEAEAFLDRIEAIVEAHVPARTEYEKKVEARRLATERLKASAGRVPNREEWAALLEHLGLA